MQRFRYDRVRGPVSEFDIYIRSFDPDHPESPETGLQRVFGFGEERARAFVDAVPRMVKRGVPAAQVERYDRALAEVGALYELRQAPIKPQQIMVVVGGDTGAREDEGGDTLTLPPPADPEPQPVIGMQATVVGAAPPGSPTSTRGGGDSARTAVDASARRGADDPDRTAVDMAPPAGMQSGPAPVPASASGDPGRATSDATDRTLVARHPAGAAARGRFPGLSGRDRRANLLHPAGAAPRLLAGRAASGAGVDPPGGGDTELHRN